MTKDTRAGGHLEGAHLHIVHLSDSGDSLDLIKVRFFAFGLVKLHAYGVTGGQWVFRSINFVSEGYIFIYIVIKCITVEARKRKLKIKQSESEDSVLLKILLN